MVEPHKVILDGAVRLWEAIWLSTCSQVTIANLTVRDVQQNGIKLNSETGVHRLRVYNCAFRNIWQRAIKSVLVLEADRAPGSPPRLPHRVLPVRQRPAEEFSGSPMNAAATFDGDYLAGIDLMFATNWVIRDNVFRGINGRTGQGRGAIFVWVDSRDCVIERNVIVDCDAGISLGNALHDPKSPALHRVHRPRRARAIAAWPPQGGVTALNTKDCKILHNTICDPTGQARRGVRVELGADGLVVANNLLSGPQVIISTESRVEAKDNRERVPASAFLDAAAGDLHLAARWRGW